MPSHWRSGAGADRGLCALQAGTLPIRLFACALMTLSPRPVVLVCCPEDILQAEGFLPQQQPCLSASLLAQLTPFLATYDTVSTSALIE